DRFGGSQYLQIGVLADVREPVVLRAVRDLADEIRPVPGVADVRTLVDPVETLTEGFGGRRGVPQTAGQAQRQPGNLADHPAMAAEAIRVRDRALTTDEVIEPAPEAEVAAVDPAELLRKTGPALVEYLKSKLPTVVARDPEGIGYVATQVEGWLAEARASVRVT